ncbi:hypothetical protein N431DRAFT_435559 [Stipitochalara longipes BDJ]|nr:hypothetical protein N431DRAFT_435559 [Stipitochalara longipes BDJ]
MLKNTRVVLETAVRELVSRLSPFEKGCPGPSAQSLGAQTGTALLRNWEDNPASAAWTARWTGFCCMNKTNAFSRELGVFR